MQHQPRSLLPQADKAALPEDFKRQGGPEEILAAAALAGGFPGQGTQKGQTVRLRFAGAQVPLQHPPVGHQLVPGGLEAGGLLGSQGVAGLQPGYQSQVLGLVAAGRQRGTEANERRQKKG